MITPMAFKTISLAIQGCCHGELNTIYSNLEPGTDLLLICGDFQALRNSADQCSINVPPKYRRMGNFHEYYSGIRRAPILTIFIGGNHECSLYLTELEYGGWVAPNIYYLGKFGSVWFRGIQIAGWSGIYNYASFARNQVGDFKLPYNSCTIRQVYHYSPATFLKMCLLNHNLDVTMSHDWPQGIEQYGDTKKLLVQKPFFKSEVERNQLGSPLNMFLLKYLRPRHWFSAHLHVRFEASVSFNSKESNIICKRAQGDSVTVQSENEIMLDMDGSDCDLGLDKSEMGFDKTESPKVSDINDNGFLHFMTKDHKSTSNSNRSINEISLDMNDSDKDSPAQGLSSFEEYFLLDSDKKGTPPMLACRSDTAPRKTTSFLALDKCGRGRQYLELINFPVKPENHSHPSIESNNLFHSLRAIAINMVVDKFLRNNLQAFKNIDIAKVIQNPHSFILVDELRPLVEKELKTLNQKGVSSFEILPSAFERVCPSDQQQNAPFQYWLNPQTINYCSKYGIVTPQLDFDKNACTKAVKECILNTYKVTNFKRANNRSAHFSKRNKRDGNHIS